MRASYQNRGGRSTLPPRLSGRFSGGEVCHHPAHGVRVSGPDAASLHDDLGHPGSTLAVEVTNGRLGSGLGVGSDDEHAAIFGLVVLGVHIDDEEGENGSGGGVVHASILAGEEEGVKPLQR